MYAVESEDLSFPYILLLSQIQKSGGRVIDRQVDYMEYVNRQIFGFETVDEYREMIDL